MAVAPPFPDRLAFPDRLGLPPGGGAPALLAARRGARVPGTGTPWRAVVAARVDAVGTGHRGSARAGDVLPPRGEVTERCGVRPGPATRARRAWPRAAVLPRAGGPLLGAGARTEGRVVHRAARA
ncbi:hypothetical protein [Streptomyces sp. CA-253872]|uniref:hypothetical protein n=1 Tax=Streptomyces sp. CA-253872 TaxID=3240067 RepID=UPI003D8AD46C